jgi:saccharopine dehydrogenase-like NADP-dependent oxidoreductase
MHVPIAQESIAQSKHMVTASYVSPEMAALDAAAKAKGVVVLNEVGLDPGIDHLLIMQSIDSIHARGGTVKELVSLCGGLPDPVAADNPLRYKMSWSPRGVLNAAGNPARYLSHGQIITVPGEELLLSTTASNRIPTLRLEVIPNRDSLSYRELYGVPHVHSICRGTLRYEGWANAMHALKAIGLFDKTEVPGLALEDTYAFLQRSFSDGKVGEASLRRLMASKGVRDVDGAMEAVRWLGLLEPSAVPAAAKKPSAKPAAAIDSLCKLLEDRLQYKEGEKDMVAMFHTVTGELPDGTVEAHTSRLLAFGTPGGDTAMSATVGYTTAAGVELALQRVRSGALATPNAAAAIPNGVIIPIQASVYEPMLKRIQDFGITWTEDIQVTKRK